MRVLAALTLSVLLSGCFSSDGPLFAETRGECPFATPTAYEEVDQHPARFQFSRDGAHCLTVDEPDRDSTSTRHFTVQNLELWFNPCKAASTGLPGEPEEQP